MTSPPIPPHRPPTALTIAGSDSSGGAGLQCDLKTFTACHVHGLVAITTVTVQNSLGVSAVHPIPPGTVAAQIETVAGDIGVDAAKTGVLSSAETIVAVADVVRRLGIAPFVVDPVAASQHGDPFLPPSAIEALREVLFPLATLVTPNVYEVGLFTGIEVRDRAGQLEAAHALKALGPQWVLVKGGHLPGPEARDVLFDGEQVIELVAPFRDTPHTHGTGDSLASATTAALARGADLVTAVRTGKDYVTAAVDGSYPLGTGRGPVGHFWRAQEWPVAR